jgi:aminopeptidase N
MAKDQPYFSTSLVIGDYDYKTSRSAGGVPLEFWYYHGQEDKVNSTYQYTEAMMDFLEKETGVKYPYPLYREAPVIDYMYGAMETTTSTVFGDFIFIDPHAFWQRNYINTNAHEMTHQWFGNCIAHLVNKDVWLTESFATYYAKIFEKSIFGKEYY